MGHGNQDALEEIARAGHLVRDGLKEEAARHLDNAILLLHGKKPGPGLTLYEHAQASDAFLEQTKCPSLSVAAQYVEGYWKLVRGSLRKLHKLPGGEALLRRTNFRMSEGEDQGNPAVLINATSAHLTALDARAVVVTLNCWLDRIGYDPETATVGRVSGR